MTRITRSRIALALAIGLMLALGSAGCISKLVKPAGSTGASSSSATPIARMTADEKRSAIATSFPIEVPVPQGRVLRGEAQGADVWDYQLEIQASTADVVSWYTTWYPKAEWQLIKDEAVGEGRRLIFTKGGYAADVTVSSAGPDVAEVTAIVGMGNPILNTQ